MKPLVLLTLLLLTPLVIVAQASASLCILSDLWAHEPGQALGPDANETFVGTPQVIYAGPGSYVMVYASGASGWATIRLATSPDGLAWTPGPVILRASDFRVQNLFDPYMMLGRDGQIALYAEGWNESGGARSFGILMARGPSVLSLVPLGTTLAPVADADWPGSPEVATLPVGDSNGSYRMYFTGWNASLGARRLFTAVSVDGRFWTREGAVYGPGPGERYGPGRFTLHSERDGLRLYYTEDRVFDRVYTAISADGRNWTREGPVLGTGPTTDRDLTVNAPFLVDFPGGARLYYMGTGSAQPFPRIFTAIASTSNAPPVAAIAAPAQVAVFGQALLDGSESHDPDAGDKVSYSWSLAARPNGSGSGLMSVQRKVGFTVDRPGGYVVRLQVTDGCGGSSTAFATITATNRPPEVSVQVSPSPVSVVGANVTLDASMSLDPEGYPVFFLWSLLSRPNASSAVANGSSAVERLALDREGSYLVEVRVNDIFGANTTRSIAILARDAPPHADGGPDRSVMVGTEVLLDASASADPGGDSLLLSWSLLTRPSASTAAATSDGANATIVPDWPGTYAFQITATDPGGLLDTDVVLVEAWNSPPLIVACCAGTWEVGSLVPLTAEVTDLENQGPLDLEWNVLVAPAGSRAVLSDPASNATTVSLDRPGVFVIGFTATDPFGAWTHASLLLTSDLAPVPLVSVLPAGRLSAGTSITLDARDSYDPEGDPMTFAWSIEDWPGRSDGSAIPSLALLTPALGSLIASTPGRYTVRLAVNDSHGASAAREIVLDATNAAPKITLFCPETVGVTVPFHCHVVAADPDPGPAPVCRWETLETPEMAVVHLNATGNASAVSVDGPGTYRLQVVCTDAFGAEGSDSAILFAPSSAPIAAAGTDRTISPGERSSLVADASTDPDGGELIYSWRIESGPSGHDAVLHVSGSTAEFTATTPGLYSILLLVEDPEGNVAVDHVSVLVEPRAAIPWELPVIAALAVAVSVLFLRRRPKAVVQKVLLLAPGERLVGSAGNGGDDSTYVAAVRSHLEKHDIGPEGTRFAHRGRSVLVSRGEHLTLAVWVQGADAERMLPVVSRTLRDIEEALAEVLAGWGGDVSELVGTERYLARLLGRR